MRTNIDIDDELIKAAKEATGLKTKKAVVEEGLRRIVRCKRQVNAINALKGAADWQGDLRSLRKNRDLAQW
ncbi:MAG TPA: type II toxin-antitoxin system VapB family antitoxin [Armatimonadota bacterium]|jgi:Arc/MetJ family transcription regulator|nr:type II toxin-antitoxin system VapB family antitoxin [Armatimonadota bacterium]